MTDQFKHFLRTFWSQRQYQRLTKFFTHILHPFKK
jgi:hypothetical protein